MSSKRRLLSACGATLLASGLLATSESAQADLLIDLRMPDGSKASNILAGQTLTLDVWAKVTSANAIGTAAFQALQGTFISSPGATNLLGTLNAARSSSGFPAQTVVRLTAFNATGATT